MTEFAPSSLALSKTREISYHYMMTKISVLAYSDKELYYSEEFVPLATEPQIKAT